MAEKCFICNKKSENLYYWSLIDFLELEFPIEERRVKLCKDCFSKVEEMLNITTPKELIELLFNYYNLKD